ncbi:MAG: YtxH domain-containing protein [Deltaproteobacteria bacterium]|nr:YtxH domain-containing protein [Deltaproteobacteria bacterium]
MAWIKKISKRLPLTFVLLVLLALSGCEGTDTREKVDDTVKELSGKKNVERMDQMKKNIEEIKKQQAEQADRLKESQ